MGNKVIRSPGRRRFAPPLVSALRVRSDVTLLPARASTACRWSSPASVRFSRYSCGRRPIGCYPSRPPPVTMTRTVALSVATLRLAFSHDDCRQQPQPSTASPADSAMMMSFNAASLVQITAHYGRPASGTTTKTKWQEVMSTAEFLSV